MILRSRRPVKTRPALNGSVIDYEKTTPVENRLDLWEDWFGVDPVSRVSQRNAFRYISLSLFVELSIVKEIYDHPCKNSIDEQFQYLSGRVTIQTIIYNDLQRRLSL